MTDRVLNIIALGAAALLVGLVILRIYNPAALGQAARPHHFDPVQKQSSVPLTAAQITGTYKEGELETLEVQALPGSKIRFYYDSLWNINAPGGPSMGKLTATLPLHANRAFYTAKDGGERLLLRFSPGSVFASQDGYRGDPPSDQIMQAGSDLKKISGLPPKFGPKD